LAIFLDSLPQLAVAPELNWITYFFDTFNGPNLEGLLAWPLVAKWLYQKKFESFAVSSEELQKIIGPKELLPCHVFIRRLLNIHGMIKGKEQVGSWTPEFMGFLDPLHQSYPWTKFIHVIRDGRNVCLDLLDRPDNTLREISTWNEDPLGTIALWWKRKVGQCRKAGQKLGTDHYYEIRLESLKSNPEEEGGRLCDFLGISFNQMWIRLGASAGDQTGPFSCQDNLKTGNRNWRTHMPEESVERFEAAAGDLLEELGYDRAFSRLRIETVGSVSRLRHEFSHPAVCRKTSPKSLVRRRVRAGWANPFVFIVGCPRSGTTLLQRILDAHPQLAICPETFWVVFFYKKRVGLTPEGHVTPELITQMLSYYKFYRMKAARPDLNKLLEDTSSISYADFVTGIFDHFGQYWRKPLAGDKTPDYVRNLPTLHSLWPQAKIVHLIRDGRDVCLSAINWKRKADRLKEQFTTWEKHPVTTAALWWDWHVRRGREHGRLLGPQLYYEVRYESLVAQADEECARLCDFLGLPLDKAMLKFHEGRIIAAQGLDAKNAWMPITAGLRDWHTQMPAKDIERFEAAAGDLLLELGYSDTIQGPSERILEETAEIRKVFVGDAERLGDWLP
jgi:hypothetical protein